MLTLSQAVFITTPPAPGVKTGTMVFNKPPPATQILATGGSWPTAEEQAAADKAAAEKRVADEKAAKTAAVARIKWIVAGVGGGVLVLGGAAFLLLHKKGSR